MFWKIPVVPALGLLGLKPDLAGNSGSIPNSWRREKQLEKGKKQLENGKNNWKREKKLEKGGKKPGKGENNQRREGSGLKFINTKM